MLFFSKNYQSALLSFFSLAISCIALQAKLPELMGTAWAEFQNSGDILKNSQWNAWQNLDRPDKPTIHDGQKSGVSCDHWNRYAQDIKLVKDVGLNACRFSLDWSMIEPVQGQFNKAALDHYHAEIDEMLKQGLTPMVTMHHFVHPQWFQDLGAFEMLENIKIFQNFCTKIFQEFNAKVRLWCTINEPACYVFQGYINKAFPPGLFDLQKAGEVLRNMLLAHVLVYQTLKAMPGGNQAQIGCVHQYLTFEPYNSWNLVEGVPAMMLNYIFNDLSLKFFNTGEYYFYIPFSAEVTLNQNIKDLPDIKLDQRPWFDFFGLNFYSRVVIQQKFWNPLRKDAVVPSCKEGEVMTDMPYPLYAQGLYDAIAYVSQFGVPIYITENGIADGKDDRRETFFKDYLGIVSKALDEGYDIRGWFYWSLMDNFEWNDGFGPRFGLYEVDFQTQERRLRPSVSVLKEILSAQN